MKIIKSPDLLLFSTAALSEEKPNVLFIAVDDMDNDIGRYGYPPGKRGQENGKIGIPFSRFQVRPECRFVGSGPSHR